MHVDMNDQSLRANTHLETATEAIKSGSEDEADPQKELGKALFHLYLKLSAQILGRTPPEDLAISNLHLL